MSRPDTRLFKVELSPNAAYPIVPAPAHYAELTVLQAHGMCDPVETIMVLAENDGRLDAFYACMNMVSILGYADRPQDGVSYGSRRR